MLITQAHVTGYNLSSHVGGLKEIGKAESIIVDGHVTELCSMVCTYMKCGLAADLCRECRHQLQTN